MKTNVKIKAPVRRTHEGAVAKNISHMSELRRTVLACLLWEDNFYESGQSIAQRLSDLIPRCPISNVRALAREARSEMNLRHAPLLVCRELARYGNLDSGTLTDVIQRPDEITEFLSLYWKDGKTPISKQVKIGLGDALKKFNEYSLAKYNRDGAIKLRDVMFLTHPKPNDKHQAALWSRLANNELKTPKTWEVMLSAGADKKSTFTELIIEGKLGGLALIRNLRNMIQAGVDPKIIKNAILTMDTRRILPFRFIAAARYAPQYEPELEQALFKNTADLPKLKGKTALLVDISGSMSSALSAKSEMSRMDAACGLAMILREVCEDINVYSFSENCVRVPPRRGFALRDKLVESQYPSCTRLGMAVECAKRDGYDRLVVISDEQTMDQVDNPGAQAYMLNVASYQNGVGYGNNWVNITGFSEACVKYISEIEKAKDWIKTLVPITYGTVMAGDVR